MAVLGKIFDVQRFSIHDGPGIRTTVFLKGCAMRCVWCHNPEGISSQKMLFFLPEKCIGCGYCVTACQRLAHKIVGGRHELDRSLCIACGDCTKECYSSALEIVGREVSADEILAEALRDQAFYETSGGGLTLSGGEPLLQIDFAEELLQKAKRKNLHCCIETSGFAPFPFFERILPFVDLFLYDVKHTDDEYHRKLTGVSNELILSNICKLHDAGAMIRLRLPIIPGLNDGENHFAGVATLAKSLPRLQRIDILPYHRLGISKLKRLGLSRENWADIQPPSPETVQVWVNRFERLGVSVTVS